ncbi:hypothetical protein [Candidatus Electronema sp. TJ]
MMEEIKKQRFLPLVEMTMHEKIEPSQDGLVDLQATHELKCQERCYAKII